MKNTLLIAASCLVLASSSAFACSPEELSKKAMELQTTMPAYLQKNPSKAQEITQKSQAISAQLQKSANVDDVCKGYDDLLAIMK
jgi:hypothetical protein